MGSMGPESKRLPGKSSPNLINKIHSMPWLKRNSNAEEEKLQQANKMHRSLPPKQEEPDYFPGTRNEKKKRKEKKLRAQSTIEQKTDARKENTQASANLQRSGTQATRKVFTESAVVQQSTSVWDAGSNIASKLFPNVQSVRVETLDEEEMLSMALAESIATVQLEQFKKSSPEKQANHWSTLYEDDDNEGWDNIRRNLPTPEPDLPKPPVCSRKKNPDTNNNRPGAGKNLKSSLRRGSPVSTFTDEPDLRWRNRSEREEELQKQATSGKSVSFVTEDRNPDCKETIDSIDVNKSGPGSETRRSSSAPRPFFIDKYGRVDGYSEKHLFMGKGARFKEQQFLQEHGQSLETQVYSGTSRETRNRYRDRTRTPEGQDSGTTQQNGSRKETERKEPRTITRSGNVSKTQNLDHVEGRTSSRNETKTEEEHLEADNYSETSDTERKAECFPIVSEVPQNEDLVVPVSSDENETKDTFNGLTKERMNDNSNDSEFQAHNVKTEEYSVETNREVGDQWNLGSSPSLPEMQELKAIEQQEQSFMERQFEATNFANIAHLQNIQLQQALYKKLILMNGSVQNQQQINFPSPPFFVGQSVPCPNMYMPPAQYLQNALTQRLNGRENSANPDCNVPYPNVQNQEQKLRVTPSCPNLHLDNMPCPNLNCDYVFPVGEIITPEGIESSFPIQPELKYLSRPNLHMQKAPFSANPLSNVPCLDSHIANSCPTLQCGVQNDQVKRKSLCPNLHLPDIPCPNVKCDVPVSATQEAREFLPTQSNQKQSNVQNGEHQFITHTEHSRNSTTSNNHSNQIPNSRVTNNLINQKPKTMPSGSENQNDRLMGYLKTSEITNNQKLNVMSSELFNQNAQLMEHLRSPLPTNFPNISQHPQLQNPNEFLQRLIMQGTYQSQSLPVQPHREIPNVFHTNDNLSSGSNVFFQASPNIPPGFEETFATTNGNRSKNRNTQDNRVELHERHTEDFGTEASNDKGSLIGNHHTKSVSDHSKMILLNSNQGLLPGFRSKSNQCLQQNAPNIIQTVHNLNLNSSQNSDDPQNNQSSLSFSGNNFTHQKPLHDSIPHVKIHPYANPFITPHDGFHIEPKSDSVTEAFYANPISHPSNCIFPTSMDPSMLPNITNQFRRGPIEAGDSVYRHTIPNHDYQGQFAPFVPAHHSPQAADYNSAMSKSILPCSNVRTGRGRGRIICQDLL